MNLETHLVFLSSFICVFLWGFFLCLSFSRGRRWAGHPADSWWGWKSWWTLCREGAQRYSWHSEDTKSNDRPGVWDESQVKCTLTTLLCIFVLQLLQNNCPPLLHLSSNSLDFCYCTFHALIWCFSNVLLWYSCFIFSPQRIKVVMQ